MSTPVDTDDLVQGATGYLLTQIAVVAVLGETAEGSPLLFQHALYTVVEGTSSTAAVISRAGGWAGGNEHNTLAFPRLGLTIYCDPQRDDGKNTTAPGEVWRRIDAAYQVFDRVLHRPQGGTQMWGTVRTISSLRLAEPVIGPMPGGTGLLRAQVFYAIEQG